MAQIGVYFSPKSMNKKQYDDIIKVPDAAGAGSPKGRLYHHAFGEGDHIMVFDVFESQVAFDAFGAQLMPVLGKLGVDPGEPEIMPMVNTIVG